MNPIPRPLRTLSFVLAASIASQSFAQFFPGGGGGGGFGGGGGGAGRSGTGSSSRSYLNNTEVGDAIFSYDPETRKIIVVTDIVSQDRLVDAIQLRTVR